MKGSLLENVTVTDIADKGRGVGRTDQKVVFIDGAVPGDVVDVIVTKKNKSFLEGRIATIRLLSPLRIEPFCSHFGICGGCKWQNMTYQSQLKFKEKQVVDAITRLAKINDAHFEPILGCESDRFYRNKLEFTFTNKRYLLESEMNETEPKEMNGVGFHIPAKFNKVLDVNHCYLQDDKSNDIRNFIREYSLTHHLPYFDLKTQSGGLRNLVIRNTTLGEWMVVVVLKDNWPGYSPEEVMNAVTELLEQIKKKFPWLTSLQYVINNKNNDTIFDQETVVYHGRPFIIEQLENLKFIIGPKSFFQTNSVQALNLYRITRQLAQLTGRENVYDLYTGTGTIAAFIAHNALKVTGVDYVPEAIEDAKQNAKINELNNLQFFAGDMKNVLTEEFFSTHGKPDVIITDPPRAGMHDDVTRRILESGAKRIVYVSCNPATQARDILMLSEKYKLKSVHPVDMFPHTSHVENVALLELI